MSNLSESKSKFLRLEDQRNKNFLSKKEFILWTYDFVISNIKWFYLPVDWFLKWQAENLIIFKIQNSKFKIHFYKDPFNSFVE